MSEAEQLETLHALSDIVTFQMGIGEQKEVIKIIDPSAILSPDVKEFALGKTLFKFVLIVIKKKSYQFH